MRASIILFLACFGASAPARAENLFAGRSFDIFFTEVQETDDPERPEIAQNRRTQIHIGNASAATRITRNWDRPPPALEHLDAAGALGAWVSLQNRARIRHNVEANTLTQTIATGSFIARLVIELDGAACKVRIENALLAGETHFRMRNIAFGTPMRINRIRTEAAPVCRATKDLLW